MNEWEYGVFSEVPCVVSFSSSCLCVTSVVYFWKIDTFHAPMVLLLRKRRQKQKTSCKGTKQMRSMLDDQPYSCRMLARDLP